uniref:C2H2-type domain-containing protein n=1 Tax=Seriola dumerili TaxID=41447 RepID=A0A3B4T552_SERDU
MGRHTGEKRFSCSVCDRRFTWLSGVKRHKCVDDTLVSVGETEADGEDFGGSEPTRNSDPDRHLQPGIDDKASDSFGPETEDSDGDWQETRGPQSSSSSTEQRKTAADGEDGGGSDTDDKTSDSSVSETETRDDHWKDSGEPPPGLDSLSKRPTKEQNTANCNYNYSCSHCGQGFEQKRQRQEHMKIHTGEKLFSCSVCGEGFAKRASLTLHMMCHTVESLHCSVCNTEFSDRESLVQHMRIHTRQTQFNCEICGKEFAWRRNLTRHMEVHAKEEHHGCSDRESTSHDELNNHGCGNNIKYTVFHQR